MPRNRNPRLLRPEAVGAPPAVLESRLKPPSHGWNGSTVIHCAHPALT